MSACFACQPGSPFTGPHTEVKIVKSQITFPAKLKRALASGDCALAASIIAIVAESVHDCDAHATLPKKDILFLEFMR